MEILKNHRIDFDPNNFGSFKSKELSQKRCTQKCQFFVSSFMRPISYLKFLTSPQPEVTYLISKIEKQN
jgi:hypothetical protein